MECGIPRDRLLMCIQGVFDTNAALARGLIANRRLNFSRASVDSTTMK